MKPRLLICSFCALLAAFPLLTGCVTSGDGEVYAGVPPPEPIVEVEGVAPGPDYVWIGGYHRWDGRDYNWVPGRWERPPREGVVWERGHWDQTERGWRWTDGRWR